MSARFYQLKNTLSIPLFFIIILSLTNKAHSKVRLPGIFGSNMVVQQNQVIKVWGWADRKEGISISLGDQRVKTKADEKGLWMVRFAPMDAGGPYTMTIEAKNTIELNNIMIGEVWLCSGQSNMEWPVNRSLNAEEEIVKAQYPEIRLLTVPRNMSVTPVDDLDDMSWRECNPESVAEFSAVGYFFGRALHQKYGVPVGLIDASWGGTEVEAWTSYETLMKNPDFKDSVSKIIDLDFEELKKREQKMMTAFYGKIKKMDDGIVDGKPIWAGEKVVVDEWKEMNLPVKWEEAGLEDLDGVVWFRKTVTIQDPPEKKQVLALGPIDDSDITWINGKKIGENINKYSKIRKYEIPDGILKKGENTIVVRVEDYRGGGGLVGKPEQLFLSTDGEIIQLAGKWKYKVGASEIPDYPVGMISTTNPNDMPASLFNGMINPLIPFAMKGGIWYQGEANAGNFERAGKYREWFPDMIRDWRTHWDQGDFPFLFVQLANFLQADSIPTDDPWPLIRESQALTLDAVPKTGMACAIDIGDANDIHPRNKQEVGKRLALNAFKIAYGEDTLHSGPRFDTIEYNNDEAILTFTLVGDGLHAKSKYGYVKGFTIAGEDKKFHYARAEIIGENKIKVYTDHSSPIKAVRYAWANNPAKANVYNSADLPLLPFRTDEWKMAPFGP